MIVVFSGPSLELDAARAILDASYRAPVAMATSYAPCAAVRA